ncbi:MAG: hypothetical protein KY455_13610 [Euryarchaeota archaeon]|nr:hypothetical protein [Euryarchaeota archaeon]
MGLELINGVGPATVKKLNKAGVRTLDDVRKLDIQTIAKKTGLAPERLQEWKNTAAATKVLDDVPGVGPAMRKKLKAAGVADLDKLLAAEADTLAEKIGVAPGRVQGWQTSARKMAGGSKPKTAPKRTTTKKAPVKATATKAAKKTKTAPVRKTTPVTEPAVTPAPRDGPEPAAVRETPRAEPPLVVATTNGSTTNGHGHHDEEPKGLLRRVVSFLTGGPTR